MNIKRKDALVVGAISLFVSLTATAETQTRFAFGPVEQLNSRTVTVLGQSYSLNGAPTARLTMGTYVLIEGATNRKGPVSVRAVQIAKAPYVPGASDVALSGIVSHFDRSTGVLTIGSLSVYSLDAVADDISSISVGSEIEVVGRQAAPSGPLWASEIRVAARGAKEAGRVSQSIEGTGISTQSIEGTGKRVQSLEGTGFVTLSIEGTGRAAQSIEGTGKSMQSIEGTGRSAQSIEGTGRSAQSIECTGLSAQSIEGTGRPAS